MDNIVNDDIQVSIHISPCFPKEMADCEHVAHVKTLRYNFCGCKFTIGYVAITFDSNDSNANEKEYWGLTIFCETPKHFDRIKFAMELGQKHTYVATAFNVTLKHRFLRRKIFLQ